MNPETCTTAVIGGGASGVVAALTASRRGERTILLEKTHRLCRKVLASGNGRCNLSNDGLSPSAYNEAARPLVKEVFSRYGGKRISDLFCSLGVHLHSVEGRVFPITNQAATVVRALELAITRSPVEVRQDAEVAHIARERGEFSVRMQGGAVIRARSVILATGGRSYPVFGSDGGGYALARACGHTIVAPVPSAVAVTTKHALCHPLQGQKILAHVRAFVNGACEAEAGGELLFTKYGLSGTAILDVSRPVSIALHRHTGTKTAVVVDLVPFMSRAALRDILTKRRGERWQPADLLIGILPNKFGQPLGALLASPRIDDIAASLKEMRFMITGTRGWNEADFTAGGVTVNEVGHRTLESKRTRGLFLCGEVLDVDGRRGGFNLAWAWASGHIAGLAGDPS